MMFLNKSKKIVWTTHAKAKMQFYKLSPARVRSVLYAPKRIEEGVAPKTVAMMQPTACRSIKEGERGMRGARGSRQETWSQEIWVMFQDSPQERKIISAWRYPGVTKPKSAVLRTMARQEFEEYHNSK